jgi:hypothetical protein
MKITKQQLKQIIKEELMKEVSFDSFMKQHDLGDDSPPVGMPEEALKISQSTKNEILENGLTIVQVISQLGEPTTEILSAMPVEGGVEIGYIDAYGDTQHKVIGGEFHG